MSRAALSFSAKIGVRVIALLDHRLNGFDPRFLIEVADPDEALVDGQGLVHGTVKDDLAVAGLVIGVLKNTLGIINVTAYWQQNITGMISVGSWSFSTSARIRTTGNAVPSDRFPIRSRKDRSRASSRTLSGTDVGVRITEVSCQIR
jgi:hypothetical protein